MLFGHMNSYKFTRIVNAAYIVVEHSNLYILCISKRHTIDEVGIQALVGGIKVDKAKVDGKNKCFYNMFGQGTNLTLDVITSGKLVTKLMMYGILVTTQKPDEARLLQVIIGFEGQECNFRTCC